MARYGTTGAKTDKELFKFAADWLNENKPKNKQKYTLGLFKEIYEIDSDVRLQNKAGKDKPAVISLRNLKADKVRDLRLKRAKELLVAAGLKSDWKAGKDLIKQPSIVGKNADHKWEVQEFGPVYEDLLEEYAAGAIDDKEFKKRLNVFVANNPGDSVKNLELIPGRQNQLKREDVEFKNKLLEQRELDNPSARYTPEYNKKMAAFKASLDVNKTNKLNGIHSFATQYLEGQQQGYETQFTPRNGNGVNGNGVNGNGVNGNGVNGKNGNGLAVNGKNGKNVFLKGMENVKDYSGITKFGRSVDQLANIGVNVSTGNYVGAGIGAATYGTSKALQNKQVQARVAKQITKLVAERGAKSAAKMIPGLDILLSGKESWDYLKRGRWDQAGVAALSGAIGWIPIVGDGASAALDLSNTGLDIARLQAPTGDTKKKGKNRLSRYLKGLNN